MDFPVSMCEVLRVGFVRENKNGKGVRKERKNYFLLGFFDRNPSKVPQYIIFEFPCCQRIMVYYPGEE